MTCAHVFDKFRLSPSNLDRHPRMRALLLTSLAVVFSACAPVNTSDEDQIRTATVKLEPSGELSLRAVDRADDDGFQFEIGFEEDATSLSTPDAVSWSMDFRNYCRNRDSWVQSVVVGPSGQVWRGYRVFVPAGPDRRQYWSSGSTGAHAYGGPSTPGLLEAATQGGKFILAIEDDEGQRWNAVSIDTLTPTARQQLFDAMPRSERRATELIAVEAPPPAASRPDRSCP